MLENILEWNYRKKKKKDWWYKLQVHRFSWEKTRCELLEEQSLQRFQNLLSELADAGERGPEPEFGKFTRAVDAPAPV